jgi:hypothetical protein
MILKSCDQLALSLKPRQEARSWTHKLAMVGTGVAVVAASLLSLTVLRMELTFSCPNQNKGGGEAVLFVQRVRQFKRERGPAVVTK